MAISRAHSADVEIYLELNGRRVELAQAGPDFVIVTSPFDHPPVSGVLVVTVDGKSLRRNVTLPAGIRADQPRVPLS